MNTLTRLVVVGCFVVSVFAQQAGQLPNPSPEHQKLALWFGEWIYEGQYETTPLGPGGRFTGKMTGRPLLGGLGGEYVFVEKGPAGETRTVEIDSYDPVAKNYPNIVIGSDGSIGHIPYTMDGNVASWEGTLVIGGKRVRDRGTDAVALDGKSFTKKEEICLDGKTWLPFATMKATKVEAPQRESTRVEQELVGLEKSWAEAVVKRDLAFLDRILADNYEWTGADGKVWSKAETLAALKSGEDEVSSIVVDDFKVRLYGDTAVVTGHSTFNETLRGKDTSGQERFTDTWLRGARGWQCVAMHCSKIARQSLDPPSRKAVEPPRSSGVVTVRGTALPYLIEGSGIPCLVAGYSTLYPGAFSNELKKHLQFIFVDWKNSFLADDPFPLATNITIETLVDDLDEVRRQLGHDKIAVLGHSYPGFLPLAYGKKYPSHASHLISIGCPPYANKSTDKASAEFWNQDASPERKAAHRRNLETWPDSLLDKLGARERWIMRYVRDRAMCWANPNYDCYWLWLGKGASMAFEHQYYSVLLADYDPAPQFREIKTPVFIANGRYDYFVPLELWEAEKGKLPNLTYHLFEKSGHWPMLEEQELFDTELLAWLKGLQK